jgi:polysaccharide lyase-like protein
MSTSVISRRAVAAILGTVVLGAAGCSAEVPGSESEPGTTSPAAAGGIDPVVLENFLGNGLQYAQDGSFGLDISRLVDDPTAGGLMLRTFYPAGSASRGMNAPDGGMQAYLMLPNPVDVLDLTYQVRFPEGFDFVKGGKLPGLFGGTVTSGQRIPDGTNGFSTRYMWRADGAGEVYAYLPTSEEHGTSLGRGCWSFQPGYWTTISQRVGLNTPGQRDGRISVWQDDQLVLDRSGLEFRTTDQLRIDGLFFSTFFGGDDPSWASPVDQHVEFSGFTLTEGTPPPPGPPSTSDDDSVCGTAGTS